MQQVFESNIGKSVSRPIRWIQQRQNGRTFLKYYLCLSENFSPPPFFSMVANFIFIMAKGTYFVRCFSIVHMVLRLDDLLNTLLFDAAPRQSLKTRHFTPVPVPYFLKCWPSQKCDFLLPTQKNIWPFMCLSYNVQIVEKEFEQYRCSEYLHSLCFNPN